MIDMAVEYRDRTATPKSKIDQSKIPQYNREIADWIRQKNWGVDVREALAQLAEKSGSDLKETLDQQQKVNELLDALDSPHAPLNAQVQVNDDGTVFIAAE